MTTIVHLMLNVREILSTAPIFAYVVILVLIIKVFARLVTTSQKVALVQMVSLKLQSISVSNQNNVHAIIKVLSMTWALQ